MKKGERKQWVILFHSVSCQMVFLVEKLHRMESFSPTFNHDQMINYGKCFDLWHLAIYILTSESLPFLKSAEGCWREVTCNCIISSFLTWDHESSFTLEQHNTISINTSMSPETLNQYWHMMTIPSCLSVIRVWPYNQGKETNNYKLQWIGQNNGRLCYHPITTI